MDQCGRTLAVQQQKIGLTCVIFHRPKISVHIGGSPRPRGEEAGWVAARSGDHEPKGDDRRVGRGHWPAAPQRHRLAGHQDAGLSDCRLSCIESSRLHELSFFLPLCKLKNGKSVNYCFFVSIFIKIPVLI